MKMPHAIRTIATIVLMMGFTSSLFAFTDEIAAEPAKVWEAAKQAMTEYGLGKVKEDKLYLESGWIMDRVEKRIGFLSRFSMKKVKRRYRLKVQVTPVEYGGKVDVTGFYQIQTDTGQSNLSWRRYKTDHNEYQIERALFMKIIDHLGKSGPHSIPVSETT